MKLAVIGATGQIGSRVVELLRTAGHEVTGVSRSSGVDVVTGSGVADAVTGNEVLVDLTNSPSVDDEPAMTFFTASSANLVAAAKAGGVGHYVALSIVGADSLPVSGYMNAKVAQENTVKQSGLPFTIVRATQFHEFADMIVTGMTVGGEVRVPEARIQPIAAADVAEYVARVAQQAPVNGVVNLGGPEKMSFAELARAVLARRGESTPVVVDSAATYFGVPVDQNSLVTGDGAVLATRRFVDE
ncbi:NAD(P)H-binding protein [Mycolicibacterium sp. 3033]|nr:NAD(P)H-binding protein [Mycolicibacterium aurantiacum]